MLIPTDKTELVQFMRELADAIEKGETEYRGCQVTQSMDREILPNGQYADISCMAFDLRVAIANTKTYEMFREFNQAQHYARRRVD